MLAINRLILLYIHFFFLDDADSVNTVPSCASVQNDVMDPDDMPLKHLVHNGKQLTNILTISGGVHYIFNYRKYQSL